MITISKSIGGKKAIEDLVEVFYHRVLADSRLSQFYVGFDIEKIMNHQTDLIDFALGGKSTYLGRNIRKTHKYLVEYKGLRKYHFDIFVGHLEQSLIEINLNIHFREKIMEFIRSTEQDVLGQY